MAKCDSCGNDYDKSFQLIISGKTYTFDSFECAIHTEDMEGMSLDQA